MEDKKDYKQQNNIQKFYFNDEGQLVVESNKGVWVDGEQYVKMYGNFSCNAKTMGAIIAKLKGINVEVGDNKTYVVERKDMYDMRRNCDILEETTYCILGVEDDVINDVLNKKSHEIAKTEFAGKVLEYERRIAEESSENYELKKTITTFNSLPWYKRIFKKIEIKTN